MSSDIVLSSALRTNLLSLQNTQSLIDRTQLRLSTGRRVNSALDNPLNFFASESLNNRATDLSRLLDGIGQSISTVEQANNGVEGLTTLVEQAQATATSAFEAAQSAQGNIRLTGNEDLRNVQDLGEDTSVTDTDTLTITVTDPDDPDTPSINAQVVTIADGDSINDLISNINDLNGSEEVIRAELDANGQLQITALNGGNVNIDFTDEQTAQGLGLDGFTEDVGAAGGTVRITQVADASLTFNLFDDGTAGDVAERTDALSAVKNSEDTNVFVDSGTGTFTISVNGDAGLITSAIDIGTASVQDLVDEINTNNNVNNLIEASFNETTGALQIRAIDSSVQTIDIQTAAGAAINGTGLGPNIGNSEDFRFSFGGGAGQLAQLEKDFDEIRAQIDSLVADADYRGTNLLAGDNLETFFNADRTSSLITEGSNLTSSGLGLTEANFASAEAANDVLNQARAALADVRNFGSTLSNSLSIIQTRESFTQSTINTLKAGSDKLTLADQNEEGANLLSLQTRQQLGITSLSLASQSQQAVLRLF